jgi:uncharacterized protein
VTTITGVVVATYRSASERAQTANQGPRTIHGILDEGLVGHVGFVMDELPYVIPMVVVRRGEELLLHGSTASRLTRHLATGAEVCVCVTHLDGIVVARSVFDNSMNYRSVVVFGRARTITDEDEKLGALHAIVERLLPGRWQEARIPSEKELRATTLLALPLTTASAKVRSGPPQDDAADLGLPVWAGEIPLEMVSLAPRPDPLLNEEIAIPESVARFRSTLGAQAETR